MRFFRFFAISIPRFSDSSFTVFFGFEFVIYISEFTFLNLNLECCKNRSELWSGPDNLLNQESGTILKPWFLKNHKNFNRENRNHLEIESELDNPIRGRVYLRHSFFVLIYHYLFDSSCYRDFLLHYSSSAAKKMPKEYRIKSPLLNCLLNLLHQLLLPTIMKAPLLFKGELAVYFDTDSLAAPFNLSHREILL